MYVHLFLILIDLQASLDFWMSCVDLFDIQKFLPVKVDVQVVCSKANYVKFCFMFIFVCFSCFCNFGYLKIC